jgi:putative CocE/NonD family hydrolase
MTDARCFQIMVPMRDGTRLNTFVFLPKNGGPRWPVILHRTPYGIAAADARDKTDCTNAWLPSVAEPMRGSILRGWQQLVAHGYVAVYQDTRGRHASEGEDHVYANDAADGHDTLEWITAQPWTNQMVGMSGSSAGATTTFAAASTRHPSLRAFFAQAGASSIYDDVVYEGQSIEMERLWLWVARNIPGLSRSHGEAVMQRFGIDAAELDAVAAAAAERYARLDAARNADPPFIGSADWLQLPLTRYPDFATWQPFLDDIIMHPAPDSFRSRHNFRRTIDIPGLHVFVDDAGGLAFQPMVEPLERRVARPEIARINKVMLVRADPQLLSAGAPLDIVERRDHVLLAACLGRGPDRLCCRRLG